MNNLTLWLVMIGMGVITFLLRASFVLLQDRIALPTSVKRALTYVPHAVLAALITPALLTGDGPSLGPVDARFFAAAIALLVAMRTKSILLTLATGMSALWILMALVGSPA